MISTPANMYALKVQIPHTKHCNQMTLSQRRTFFLNNFQKKNLMLGEKKQEQKPQFAWHLLFCWIVCLAPLQLHYAFKNGPAYGPLKVRAMPRLQLAKSLTFLKQRHC